MIKLITQNGNINFKSPVIYKNPVKPYIDTSLITDWRYFFQNGYRSDWDFKNTDFSGATTLERCFYNGGGYVGEIEVNAQNCTSFIYAFRASKFTKIKVNAENAELFTYGFYGSSNLTEIEFTEKPKKCTTFNYCFGSCTNLETIKGLDFSGVTTNSAGITSTFSSCSNLVNCEITGTLKILSSNFRINACTKLTRESVVSFANAIEDNSSGTSTYTLYFGADNLAKLTEEEKAALIAKKFVLA